MTVVFAEAVHFLTYDISLRKELSQEFIFAKKVFTVFIEFQVCFKMFAV